MLTHRSPVAFNSPAARRKARTSARENSPLARLVSGLVRSGLLLVIFALAVATPFIGYSASSPARPESAPARAEAADAEAASVKVTDYVPAPPARTLDLKSGAGGYPVLAALFQTGETVETFDGVAGNCDIPKFVFSLGDTVCVRVSGAHLGEGGNPAVRVKWAARTGSVVQSDDVTTEQQEFRLSIPAAETTSWNIPGNGIVEIDNRGLWKVYTASAADSSMRTPAFFLVRAAQTSADLSLHQSVPSAVARVAAGSNSFFQIFLTNNGPNDAQNVVLTDATPAGTTFLDLDEDTGFGFVCTDAGTAPATCTAQSLPAGSTAKFTFSYQVDGTTAPGTDVTNVVTVTSATTELDAADNTSTLSSSVLDAAGAETCSITCREDMVVTADAVENNVLGAFVEYGSPGQITGDCGAISTSPSPGTFFPVGTHTVTVTSESGGGSCSFTIEVLGTPAPTISCPLDVTTTVAEGETEATVTPGAPTTNPSDGVTVVGVRSDLLPEQDPQNPGQRLPVPLTDPYPVGTTTITWTVTDATGRTASCAQRINVRATPRPALTISCPTDVNATAPAGECEATVTTGSPTTNLTDEHVTVVGVRSDSRALNAPYPAGETRVTWTATDATSGNVVSCIQTIIVTGSGGGAPTLNVPPDVEVTTASCSAVVDDELGVATGEAGSCGGGGGVSITRTGIPRRFIFPTGTTVITYTAKDASGNTTTGTQRVTVRELTKPTITAPADVSAFANSSCEATGVALGSAVIGDNCPGSTVANDAPASFPLGQTVVTWTVTDRSGNKATDTQVVTVTDNTAPTVEAPESLQASADANCQVAVPTVTVNASDNCTAPGALTITQSPAAGTMVGLGTHTVTVTVKDAAGNSSSDTTEFTVADTTAPTLNVPTDIVVGNDLDSCSAVVNFSVTATDNCSTPEVTTSIPSGSVFQKGTTTVTATATDAAGNVTNKSFKVTVNDTQPPAVTHPASFEVYLPLNSTAVSMPVTYAVSATDNCPGVTLEVNPPSGSVFPVGTTTVTATATDTSGNVTTKQFTVTVLYNFTGFFSPIDNQPVWNQVKAGQAIPVKFSLSGNKGLNIFAAGSPASGVVACNSTDPINDVEGIETAGGSTLTYDAATDRYHYTWKTEKAWVGTCRQLVIQLNDGSFHRANFKFK